MLIIRKIITHYNLGKNMYDKVSNNLTKQKFKSRGAVPEKLDLS